ncbi:hypothetical protein DIPPA_07893 [Diplonema papillatum]|nr:hypothetical protein DIPPA_07893 [Diplonema papillatum]
MAQCKTIAECCRNSHHGCLQHDMPMCGVGGEETEATPKSRRKLRPSVQSATREAADAGANTAIENAAEGDDTRTAAGNEAAV